MIIIMIIKKSERALAQQPADINSPSVTVVTSCGTAPSKSAARETIIYGFHLFSSHSAHWDENL